MVRKLRSQGKRWLILAGVVLIYATPVLMVRGAFDAFLKIDGVPGESSDAKHKDWIEILSFSHSVSSPVKSAAGATAGRSSGKSEHKDLVITKRYDKSSPILFQSVCNGKHIPSVSLELARASGDKITYLKYKLSDVLVSSVSVGGSTGGTDTVPTEQVSFNYAKIEWSYTVVGAAGGTPTEINGGWDLAQNKKL